MSQHRIPSDLDPSRSARSGSPIPEDSSEESSSKSFSSLMQNNPVEQTTETMINPMQLAQMATAGPPNPATLLAQMQMVQNNMLNVQGQIANPNLKLNNSQKSVIKNKLISANSNLEAAHLKMGGSLDHNDEDAGDAPSKGPIAKFLGMLSNGIDQLESTKQHVKTVSINGQLSPADFLLIQIKLAKASQEIEFTGVLLSKTLDGFKQLMSVQL
ncbi:MAG: hypothetical protein V4489_05825 [Chlamydiota bacterium]